MHENAAPPGQAPLDWLLLTSEPVSALAEAWAVVGLQTAVAEGSVRPPEEFHRAWKSGCRVEERRLQSAAALERLAVVLAFVGVRLLQLRPWADGSESCECVLAEGHGSVCGRQRSRIQCSGSLRRWRGRTVR